MEPTVPCLPLGHGAKHSEHEMLGRQCCRRQHGPHLLSDFTKHVALVDRVRFELTASCSFAALFLSFFKERKRPGV